MFDRDPVCIGPAGEFILPSHQTRLNRVVSNFAWLQECVSTVRPDESLEGLNPYVQAQIIAAEHLAVFEKGKGYDEDQNSRLLKLTKRFAETGRDVEAMKRIATFFGEVWERDRRSKKRQH